MRFTTVCIAFIAAFVLSPSLHAQRSRLEALGLGSESNGGDLNAARVSSRKLGSALDNEDPNTVVFSRYQFTTLTQENDRWDVMPEFDDILLDYARRNTNLKISKKHWHERVVRVDDFDKMYTNPLLFMTGEGDFRLTVKEAEKLGEFLKRGGFVYADDCYSDSSPHDKFFRAFLREMKKAMPENDLEPVPFDHPIYHCFYDFDRGAPWCKGVHHRDMGLFYKGRMVAFLTAGDVHCGWGDRYTPPGLQEPCLKMGVNIIVYALTH